MAAEIHPFPSRTRKLSSPAPMVLGGRPPGRVGRRRNISRKPPARVLGVFSSIALQSQPLIAFLAASVRGAERALLGTSSFSVCLPRHVNPRIIEVEGVRAESPQVRLAGPRRQVAEPDARLQVAQRRVDRVQRRVDRVSRASRVGFRAAPCRGTRQPFGAVVRARVLPVEAGAPRNPVSRA